MKFELKSYQEMVVDQIRQMSEDNQQLNWLKNRVVKERNKAKAYEESLGKVCEKLRKTKEENRIVRQRTLMQHEENKEEVCLFNWERERKINFSKRFKCSSTRFVLSNACLFFLTNDVFSISFSCR